DAAVRVHHDVIRSVQRLALIALGEHRERAVIFRARHPAGGVLAGDEASLPVTRVAIGVMGGLTKHTHAAGLFHPAQHAIVGDVTPHQEAPIPKPAGALGPQRSGVEALDWRVTQAIGPETWIEDFDGGIRIPHRARPTPISDVRRHVYVSFLLPLRVEAGVILKGAYRRV